MKQYLILLREPDGRTEPHTEEDNKQHQLKWQNWFKDYGAKGNFKGGKSLTLNGAVIKGYVEQQITHQPFYTNENEIVGGYLLMQAADMNEVIAIMRHCPVYERNGFAEIREIAE